MGDLNYFGLMNVLEQPVPQANNKIPNIVYMIYQNMFAALVPAISIGAAAERGRVGPACIFMFCWACVVYAPIARAIWVRHIPSDWGCFPDLKANLFSCNRLLKDGLSSSVCWWVFFSSGMPFRTLILADSSFFFSFPRTTLEEDLSKSAPESLDWCTRSTLANVEVSVPIASRTSPTPSVTSSSERLSSGLDGSDSTVDQPSPPTSRQLSLSSTPILREVWEELLGW